MHRALKNFNIAYSSGFLRKFEVSVERYCILRNRMTIFINYIAVSLIDSRLIEFEFGHDEVCQVPSKQRVFPPITDSF
jgi:hypothetical protein